jgi:pimeloyl-ACP methyl ester carboxylesterase
MTPSRLKAALVQRGVAFEAALFVLSVSALLLVSSPALATGRVAALSWAPCPSQAGFECATAKVPLDYRNPGRATIQLAVIRHRAVDPSRRIGTLFLNPGGPGAAKALLPVVFSVLPDSVRRRFDVVTWDPRGFGESTSVQCFASQAAEDRFLARVGVAGDTFPVGAVQMAQWIQRYAAFGRHCGRRNPTLLRHMSTAESARDMDLLRQAAGETQLSYYGNSYGTFLGATYANLFPGRVRAMIFGSNMNPAAWVGRKQGAFTDPASFLPTFLRQRSDVGARTTLNAFLDLCGRTSTARCAFSAGSAAATRAKFDALLRRLQSSPSGTNSSYAALVSAVGAELYGVGGWGALASKLQRLWRNGSTSRAAASAAAGPSTGAGAKYASFGQFLGVVCGESPNPGPPAYPSIDAFALGRSGPVSGGWAWLAEPCATWPTTAAVRYAGPWRHRTANPVLVIGITHDPATPYEGAVAMSNELARARLLTVDGYGHGTFGQIMPCMIHHVTRYLIDKILPPPRSRCRGVQPFQ